MKSIGTEKLIKLVKDSNFRFIESMEDLVRIRDELGEIIYENEAIKRVIKNVTNNDVALSETSKLLFHFYRDCFDNKEFKLDNRLYSVKISPIYNEYESVIGYIEVYRDITDEKNLIKDLYVANKKIKDDMELAKNIQMSILPKKNFFKNINFQYGYMPSNNLSGDLFDVIEIDKDKIGVYIADVVGHGISASIMTMFIRQSMRSILQEHPNLCPSNTIVELKKMFSQLGLEVNQYFTIIYILIDTKKKEIIYVNAGHNGTPILFNDKHLAYLQNSGKFISNLFSDVKYKENRLKLVEGDKLLIYTDGLIETVNEKGEFFGEDRLVKWIRKNKKKKNFVNSLLEEIKLYMWKEQKDDLAVLYLEIGEENEN